VIVGASAVKKNFDSSEVKKRDTGIAAEQAH